MWTEEAHNCEMKFLKAFADWFHCVSFLQNYCWKNILQFFRLSNIF